MRFATWAKRISLRRTSNIYGALYRKRSARSSFEICGMRQSGCIQPFVSWLATKVSKMRLAFLQLPVSERALYFEQTALRRSLHPAIMEKDFWVCWLLSVLFAEPEFNQALVFKGGTSLSKVFGVIQRFSEDIDLSLSPAYLGVPEDEEKVITSRTKRDAWMERLQKVCETADRIQPAIERKVCDLLGTAPRDGTWTEFLLDPETQSPVILFHYPVTQASGFAYLLRNVKMEFCSLTDQRPVDTRRIRPWIADELENSFQDWKCEVIALELDRSYWEKATILHAEHHRAPESRMPVRFSRHYADMAALARHSESRVAVDRHDVRERVVAWKDRFFARKWARYDLAKPGTFRLIPPTGRIAELRGDYSAMRDMYMVDPLPFDDVLATLADLEATINGVATT